jgi:5'-deoxynucleotidase YfbR-like HD superfamily hydrolase
LASIVARRLHGPHDELVRKALPVVEKLHKQTEDENTKIFLELLLDVASSGPEFPVREFGRYLAAKNAPRNGWVNRGITFPETVGAHTASLLWLCKLIPEGDYPGVDYSRIKKMLEMHDLAEGITSDIASRDHREEVEKIETHLMRRFSWLGLYMDPKVDLFDAFTLHEEFSQQQSQEARIARDIDRLDILVQGWSLLNTQGTFDRDRVRDMWLYALSRGT